MRQENSVPEVSVADPNIGVTSTNTLRDNISRTTIQNPEYNESENYRPSNFEKKDDGSIAVSPDQAMDVDDLSGKPKWYIDKDIPGHGDRPEWLHEGKTVFEMAQRADALRRQIGQIEKAPEEYVVNIDPTIADYFHIDANNDPLINEFKNKALASNLSQDGFDEILNMYLDYQAKQALDLIEMQQKEYDRLGIDAEATYDQIKSWGKQNLKPEEYEVLQDMSLTAKQMMLMKSIIGKFSKKNNIPGDIGQPAAKMDQKERINRYNEIMKMGSGRIEALNKLYGIK